MIFEKMPHYRLLHYILSLLLKLTKLDIIELRQGQAIMPLLRMKKSMLAYIFFLEANRGIFATAKNDNKGTIKYIGLSLKLVVTTGIKINV